MAGFGVFFCFTRFGGVLDHMIVDGAVPRVRGPGRFWELLASVEVFKGICLGPYDC